MYETLDKPEVMRDEVKDLIYQACELEKVAEDIMFWNPIDLLGLTVARSMLDAKSRRLKHLFDKLKMLESKNGDETKK